MKKHGYFKFHSCDDKYRYKDYNDAMHHAKVYARRSGCKYDVYECQFCGGWHLTRRAGD